MQRAPTVHERRAKTAKVTNNKTATKQMMTRMVAPMQLLLCLMLTTPTGFFPHVGAKLKVAARAVTGNAIKAA